MAESTRSRLALAAAGVAGATFLTGCGPSVEDQWASSPGTKGFINLDAVKEEFVKCTRIEEFERRVNEIYEGDNLIIFVPMKLKGSEMKGYILAAAEDLDDNLEFTENVDERLFTITVKGRNATLKGAGVNSYYTESFPYSPPPKKEPERTVRHHYYRPYGYMGMWYWGGGYGYYNPYYGGLRNHRSGYRRSSNFSGQVATNNNFEKSMESKHGATFTKSVASKSPAREKFVKKKMSSPTFKKSLSDNKKSSGWGKRSDMAKSDKSFKSSKSFNPKGGTNSRSSGFSKNFRGSSGFGI